MNRWSKYLKKSVKKFSFSKFAGLQHVTQLNMNYIQICSRVLIIYSRKPIFSNTSHQLIPVYLHMHSLETINTLSLFEDHIKNNFTQLTFKFQIKIKKLDTNLVETTHTNNRANLYYHVLIQVNTMWILNITNSLR